MTNLIGYATSRTEHVLLDMYDNFVASNPLKGERQDYISRLFRLMLVLNTLDLNIMASNVEKLQK
jgi:hypothetical protein